MSGFNGSGGGYPPPRPPASYSPATPNYGDNGAPPFRPPPSMPNFPPSGAPHPPPHGNNFPPFPPGPPPSSFNVPPTPTFHSPYDEYNPSGPNLSPPPPKFGSFDRGRKPVIDTDVYDPYQPSQPSGYGASTPLGVPPPSAGPRSGVPMSAVSAGPRSASFGSPMPPFPPKRGDTTPDLPLLTQPTTTVIGNYTATVYSLPPSHLPITKYVSVNPGDAVDIHRALCQSGKATSVWYAEGSNRAGEGWGAAVEWNLESGMSGAKLRTCVGMTDSLGTEVGAMLKAVEGFYDQLQLGIRNKKPMSHEFILFSSSPAAIVSLDTSSRPESIEFNKIWREICTDILHAHLTLVYLPNGSQVDGFVLAQKIANVASSNSFTKRRRERAIDEMYNRPGGGEPLPSSSTEPGPWQRGDADPSFRKEPFVRPVPIPSPEPPLPSASPEKSPMPTISAPSAPVSAPPEPEDEPLQPRAGALCVTHFPDSISAKDLGILFAQFGDIQSVDIFSIPTVKTRFAFVAYADPKISSPAAVAALHRQPIDLDTPFARENAEDLASWKGFTGVLTIEETDADRLIPPGVAKYFPTLPDYATSLRRREPSAESGKRERDDKHTPTSATPSPKKRRTSGLPSDHAEVNSPASNTHATLAASGPRKCDGRPSATPPPKSNDDRSHPLLTGSRAAEPSPAPSSSSSAKPPLTITTTSDPQVPITLSGKTLRAQLNLVQKVFVKHDTSNWIAHTCLIATDLDQARRQLQDDLYATDDASLLGRDLESTLAGRGFAAPRIDSFVAKVLKVLDGIASADELEAGGPPPPVEDDTGALQAELQNALKTYPEQTREAMAAAATVLEYLNRAKEEQEKKRLQIERRVGVLEGMAKIGEQVSKVVSYLLSGSQ